MLCTLKIIKDLIMIKIQIVLAVVAFIALTTSCQSGSVKKDQARPNIIFFIADDMRPEHFNFQNEGTKKIFTPNLDRLASEGAIMMNQYVASPVCSPSRFNCLTGKYASRANNAEFLEAMKKNEGQSLIQWNTHVVKGESFLPTYLKKAGYKSGMVGKNHAIQVDGLETFPDYYADPRSPDIKRKLEENYNKVQKAILDAGFDYADALYDNNPNWNSVDELAVHNLDWIAEAGVNFIDQYHDDPFFLYFASTVPHAPASEERNTGADPKATAKGYLDIAPNVLPPREELGKRLNEVGLGGNGPKKLLWLDDALGALIQKLEEYDILDNTIIFFFNDHGQMDKGTLYQGGTLCPSVVWKAGGFACGNVNETKIVNVDFAPTILDFANIKYPADAFDGISFKDILNGKSSTSRESLFFELGFGRAIIKGDFKYYALRYPKYAQNWSTAERQAALDDFNNIFLSVGKNPGLNTNPAKPFSHLYLVPGGGDAERRSYGKRPGYFDLDQLYDLKNDPEELVNLAKDPNYNAKLEEMKKELQKYLDDLPGKFEL